MTASTSTVPALARVIRKYVAPGDLPDLKRDLLQVSGHSSVVSTLALLARELEKPEDPENQ